LGSLHAPHHLLIGCSAWQATKASMYWVGWLGDGLREREGVAAGREERGGVRLDGARHACSRKIHQDTHLSAQRVLVQDERRVHRGVLRACAARRRERGSPARARGGRAGGRNGRSREREREEVFVLSFSHGKAFRLCGRQKGRCGY
jgi:hypothetical protein